MLDANPALFTLVKHLHITPMVSKEFIIREISQQDNAGAHVAYITDIVLAIAPQLTLHSQSFQWQTQCLLNLIPIHWDDLLEDQGLGVKAIEYYKRTEKTTRD